MALAVDDLVGQRELVTRALPEVVSKGEPVSGGAALADGRIALIVDCDALAADYSTLEHRSRFSDPSLHRAAA
jgi:chemotaxis protein histidine kinase CheA